MRISSCLFNVSLAAVAMVLGSGASAQTYPVKSIRMIVAFTPGGGNDILARLVGEKMRENWGEQVVVDNRPGANGTIGTEIVAKAPPDGYTLLMGYDGTLVINPLIVSKLPYDTLRDFAPVTKATDVPLIIVAHPSVPANSLQELIALAKSRPGKINFSSSGIGSTPHLAAELIKASTGIDMVHVPYKGGASALVDVLGGQMPLLFIAVPPVQGYVKQGRLKAIAVTSVRRSPALPDVPTVAESGLPGFDVPTWFGLVAPKATPRPVVLKLQTEVARILHLPDVKERLATLGFEPVGNTPEEFTAQIKADIAKWSKVVKQANIRID